MRSAYVGPAEVLIDDTEHHVTADLWTHTDTVHVTPGQTMDGLKSWGGTITGLNEAAAWELSQGDTCRLRVGDREGDFIPADGNLNGGPLGIQGSGPAPFDT